MSHSILDSTLILAQAASGGAPGGFIGSMPFMMILMMVLMYVLMIRPQQVKMKELQKLIAAVKVGDHVVMDSGIHGIITSVKDRTVMLKVADNVKIEFERSKIAAVSKKSDVVEATTA
jgi:preprotein translocase subunit YajC